MSALASWFLSRSANRLLADARQIRADRDRRIDPARVGEFAGLAESVNHVLDDLQGTMSALESQNQRMEAVLQGMGEPVLALDPQHVITLSNRAAVEVLGLSDPPLGRKVFDVLPAPELERLNFEGQRGKSGPSSVELELGGLRLLAQATRQRDGSGSVLVLHDITGIRRLEKMRRDFVANVSHELRTPVAVLQANAETLLDGALDERGIAEKLVEAIHRQTGRLSSLVADLLDISRIEAGQYHLEVEPVSVAHLCRQSVDEMERPASTRRVQVQLDVQTNLWALADSKAIDQILTNLLDNAIKYGRPGGSVTLRTLEAGSHVRFEVQDDGPGIDRKHHSRLFERFYRVDKGRSRGMGGTGLGLSIVKHLVETMGGHVGYRPASPHGSVFWLELPAVASVDEGRLITANAALDAL
ncbi:MAG: PAS domain-containing protein, partial [Deltaproteobacteria bacterium]|nr:PAS domain-containing protein [Deltaproteobacteria bacterium]